MGTPFFEKYPDMENRSAFFGYPRFFTMAVTLAGWCGTCVLVPGRLADPRIPIPAPFGHSHPMQQDVVETHPVFSVPTYFEGRIFRDVQLDSKQKAIALTFDDGPWPKTTPQVLDILKRNNIKATFFWIGRNLQTYPEIGRQVVSEGHAVGNHTWHHRYSQMNPVVAAAEIEKTSDLIYRITGARTFLFRPPGGYLNNGVAAYARHKKYAVTMWSVDPGESHPRRTVSMLVNSVVNSVKPGGIVLLHDGGSNHSRTVQALPQIIAELKHRGYQFVTVPQLLAMQKQTQTLKSGKQKPSH